MASERISVHYEDNKDMLSVLKVRVMDISSLVYLAWDGLYHGRVRLAYNDR